jgi:SNF2 family DNA or RNA helicase
MIHTDAPVLPHRKAMFVPIESFLESKTFDNKRLNVRDFDKYKLTNVDDQDYVVLPWSMKNLRRLALHDVMVPGPIRWDYHWPSKYPRPLDHQVVTSDYLTQNPRAFLFSEIGTSKTLSALWAADYLMTQGEITKVLIVSTVSTLERVWELEILSNLIGRTYTLVDGSKERRIKKLAEDVDYYITNHDGLKTIEKELTDFPFDLIIVDEGAVFKNQKTALWRSCFNVCGVQTNRWLWWMTGSPMPNAPTDVWSQAKIVRPDTVPQYFGRFRNQVMFKQSMYKWIAVEGYEEVVYSMLRPVIRFPRDVCDLPEEYSRDIVCEMSDEQKRSYTSMFETLSLEMNSQVVTALNEAVKVMKLVQIACGAAYAKDGSTVFMNAEPKFKELDELFEFSERKLIVYAPFKFCLPMIAKRYQDQGFKIGIVSGDTPKRQRNDLFKQFQDGDLEMLVAHPQCMAHGLTLTRSNVIAWWGPIDNFDIYDQACGRIKRTGQAKAQYICHLACSKAELAVYKRNASKDKMQGIAMDLFKMGA